MCKKGKRKQLHCTVWCIYPYTEKYELRLSSHRFFYNILPFVHFHRIKMYING